MIPRPLYLNALRSLRNVPLVKILAGVRRCGKSTILAMLREELIASGIPEERILARTYTSEDIDHALDDRKMYLDIRERMKGRGFCYLLLDEVQEIENWEKAINSLLEEGNADIYVTGSNSRLMASEISTYLSGLYVSIPVYPLSLGEYQDFRAVGHDPQTDPGKLFDAYLRTGGFPVIAAHNFDFQTVYQIVEGILASVVEHDIARRHNIANYDLFTRVVKYVLENVGKTFSANAIVKFLKGEGRSLTVESIYNYLSWLEKAFVVYRCPRYDLQRKSVLKTQEKFFVVDPAFKYCRLGFDRKSIASMLENIVYLELKRRRYDVYIGKDGTREVDFVAVQRDERIYVQVCRQLPEDSDRETANILAIRDQYPKYVVTMENLPAYNERGVRIMHIADFLLQEKW